MLLPILLTTGIAMADPAQPDNLQIRDVKCFRDLIETDDFLAVVSFDIGYTTAPEAPASDYFILRLINSGTGADIGQQLPFSFGLNGYQYGITGFYFSASTTPAWNDSHSIRLEGNPTKWTTLPTPSVWALTVIDYSSGSGQATNRSQLLTFLITAIQQVEQDWDVMGDLATTTTSGFVLKAAGQYYMLGAIPGLNYMAPDIFLIKEAPIVYPDDKDWSDRGDAADIAYSGTQIEDFKELLSIIMGSINPTVASSIVVMIGILGLLIVSYMRWNTTEWAYMVAPVLLHYSARLTFIPWALFGIFCFLAISYVLYMKLFKYG